MLTETKMPTLNSLNMFLTSVNRFYSQYQWSLAIFNITYLQVWCAVHSWGDWVL